MSWELVRLAEVRWAAIATGAFGPGAIAQLLGAPSWLSWTFFAVCYAAGGWQPGLAGLRALRRRSLDVDLLMVVAALAAAAIGQALDGALLIVIFATSGALEAIATRRTEDSVRGLLALAPDRASRLAESGEEVVNAAELRVGDLVLVRPGERIGADGQVEGGTSEVDQASITGEPLPVPKLEGSEVFAGTLNGSGALYVRVIRTADQWVVARIAALVDEASATKARTQLFIERVEQRYSIGVVAATLALFAIPLALGEGLQSTLLRAMTFMIVASPCAVVLATMPPLLSAIANAGRHGVLVKSAVVMEQLAVVTRVAFDKTGTLTEGAPQVTGVVPLLGAELGEARLLELAAAAEQGSEHPLGRAITAAARARDLHLVPALDFCAAPGRGVRAVVEGHLVEVCSPAAVDDFGEGNRLAEAQTAVASVERAGGTALVVLLDGEAAGVLALADRMRPGARETAAQLGSQTGQPPVLLTGDNAGAAAHVAREAGFHDVRSGLLPADKASEVRQLQSEGARVLLVGDGVNDAPAIAAADVGMAMGRQGSDLALETADAVVVRDELETLPAVLQLSRRTKRLVKQNLVIAATFIVVLVSWDLLGHLPLPLGVAGHEGSTVIVGLNGLRLLRGGAWPRTGVECGPAPAVRQARALLREARTRNHDGTRDRPVV